MSQGVNTTEAAKLNLVIINFYQTVQIQQYLDWVKTHMYAWQLLYFIS